MDLVRLFFSPTAADTRGEVFFHLAYNGLQFDKAINADNVNSILAEPIFQVMLNKNYNRYVGPDGDKVNDTFITFVKDVATHHNSLDDGLAINAGTGAPIKQRVFKDIYQNLHVPAVVKKFFETHLKVVDLTPQAKTVTVTSATTMDSVRFNLVKISSSSTDKTKKLFVSTLPLLPIDGIAPELLHTTYNTAFVAGAVSGNTSFDLDSKVLIKNCIIARDTPIPASATAGQTLEDLYESVVTGVRYVRDSTGILRVIGKDGKIDDKKDFEGNELEEALKSGTPNCATTGIDLADCTVVYKCLLSGKPETLSGCLDKLQDANMFSVARKEVGNMNPKVAVQLLRTFGFKPRKEAGSNVVLPPKFDEWYRKLESTVGADTATAIRTNKKLMEYLRAVVEIIRSNPAIINKDLKNGVASDFARKCGLSVFKSPYSESAIAKSQSNVDGVLFTSLVDQLRSPLALRIQNISGRVPFMMGGGHAECLTSENLKVAFNKIYAEMEKNGKVLVDNDKSRIQATIEKLGKLESSLVRLMDDAKLFSKLNSALNPGEPVSSENVTLDNIMNVRSENIAGSTLNNLNDCISRNIRDQTQLTSDMVNKVQHPLLQLLLGRGSDALSQVN
jgi:hypothetical protein